VRGSVGSGSVGRLSMRYRVAVSLGKILNAASHIGAKQSTHCVAHPDERHANRAASMLEWCDRSNFIFSVTGLQGIISVDFCENVIDRNKIRRSKNDIRKEINANAKISAAEIPSLYFDEIK